MSLTFETRDEFNRIEIAEKMLKILESEIDISPIVIDGKWGTGKSEFCEKFIAFAKNKSSHEYIYIDCFKHDSSDDPLLMLLSAVSNKIENPKLRDDLIKKSVPVLKVVGGYIGKAALSWALQTKADKFLGDLSKAVSISKESVVKGVSEASEKIVDVGMDQVFEDLEKIQENITLLRNALEQIALTKKIIIVIDELDRCRPVFALNVLEKVKHIFDINGIKIIFSTNLSHLESVAMREYGDDIDAEKYLTKFYKYKIVLNDETTDAGYKYENNSYNEFLRLLDRREELKDFLDTENSHQFFKDMILRDKLTLRDVENFFRNYDVLQLVGSRFNLKPHSYWFRKLFILYGIYLHSFKTNFSTKLLAETLTEKDVVGLTAVTPADFLKFDGHPISAVIFFMLLRDLENSKIILDLQNGARDKYNTLDDFSRKFWNDSHFSGGSLGDSLKTLKDIIKELHLSSKKY